MEGVIRIILTHTNNAQLVPDGCRSYCIICETLLIKENKENLTQEERDVLNEKRREKYHSDPIVRERIIEESKRYYANNTEKANETKRKWIENNKEYVQEKSHENYIKNQEDRKEIAKQDRIKIKEANSKLSIEEILNRTPIKHCNSCDKDKTSFEYYIDLSRLNGLSRICKECSKEKTIQNRLKKLNKV